nr:uncharacterized protein LOC114822964 [Malus domestica]
MPQMVAELVSVEGTWEREIIQMCFTIDEAQIILSMPLSHFGCADHVIWHYTRNGVYSVKSGYLVAQEMNRNGELGRKGGGQTSTNDTMASVRRDLWSLKVPPKLCHFIWRRCQNILAVRTNLQRKGVRLSTGCPFCDCEEETQLEEACTFMRWVVYGLWRISKCRNSVVFEKVVVEPNVALQLLRHQWKEIVKSDKDLFFDNSSGCIGDGTIANGWLKPPFGTIKINCDSAWCNRTSVGGYGWVARDFAGIFKGAGGVGKVFCVSNFMAEAEALWMAVMATVDRGFTVVHVETDSKVLVDMVHGKLQLDATMEAILWDINLIKQQLCSIEVSYTPRAYNKAAHLVVSYVTRMVKEL